MPRGKEATVTAGQILQGLDGDLTPAREWRMVVTDASESALCPAHQRGEAEVRRGSIFRLYLVLRMSCVGASPPALVRGSRGSGRANSSTSTQANTETKTGVMMIPAAMIASSRFVRSSISSPWIVRGSTLGAPVVSGP
jgi:hypothetical protein